MYLRLKTYAGIVTSGANIHHIAMCNCQESCDFYPSFCRKHPSDVCQDFDTCLVMHLRVPFLELEGFLRTVSFFPCVTVATLCWMFGNQQSLVFSRLMRIHCYGSSLFHVLYLAIILFECHRGSTLALCCTAPSLLYFPSFA